MKPKSFPIQSIIRQFRSCKTAPLSRKILLRRGADLLSTGTAGGRADAAAGVAADGAGGTDLGAALGTGAGAELLGAEAALGRADAAALIAAVLVRGADVGPALLARRRAGDLDAGHAGLGADAARRVAADVAGRADGRPARVALDALRLSVRRLAHVAPRAADHGAGVPHVGVVLSGREVGERVGDGAEGQGEEEEGLGGESDHFDDMDDKVCR